MGPLANVPLPLPATHRSDDQQDAGPYVLGQVVPVVDHHLEIGVCAIIIAAASGTPICATCFQKGRFSRVIHRSFESYRGASAVFEALGETPVGALSTWAFVVWCDCHSLG